MHHFNTALQTYLRALLGVRRARLARARERGDLGASAVELAIITAVILGIAVALLAVIKTFVSSESSQIHG
jgi:Flp pilus assembly pilin Flp